MAPTISVFSIAMGADYSFELLSIVHSVPQFFMHNKSILGGVSNRAEKTRMGLFSEAAKQK